MTATRVCVIYTGGTIGMEPEDPGNPSSPLHPVGADRLGTYIPNPLKLQTEGIIEWDIQLLQDDNGETIGPLDSSSVGPRHWVYMAEAIERAYTEKDGGVDKYDGFVILHGTDTMAYTASALSFLLQNLAKPVILTGSQLPIFQPRTDAVMNFINSLMIAGYRVSGLPRLTEVAICFGDLLLRGNRTTKVSTARWQGFDTPNYPHLGRIGEHIVIDKSLALQPPNDNSPFFAHKLMEERVATVPLYPGMDVHVLSNMLSLDVRGIILRTFGTGNAPENSEFVNVLAEAVRADKIIVNTTQCLEGTVEMGLYAASSGLQEAGVITGLDLTPEAALTKLMWLLATEVGPNEVSMQMQVCQRGEQSGSVFDIRYGPLGKVQSGAGSDKSPTPVDVARASKHPSGQFETKKLRRAVLRLNGVRMDGLDSEENAKIGVFVNLIPANPETSINVPQFAGYLEGKYLGPSQTVLVRDIASTIIRVHETGRPINLNFVALPGRKFSAEGAYLTLFNE